MHVAATKPRAPILLHLRYSLTCEGRGQRARFIVTTALRTHKCISAAEQPEPAESATLPPCLNTLQTKSYPFPPGLSSRFISSV
ncbi:hypothetical protein CgunFtcFv8_018730 [Champsocephalus gunnari]|uniref:Uncharacterized protein n=1 Tax=Champsocephalus gunnari TaxID=52237 RepID=A0AAN8BU76_CHAGU|nr:hypothetical protein CgunFtcFv8_018730 [Champsocephalus gunnari]